MAKNNADLLSMFEKNVMQILRKNGILNQNKTFGIVEEVIDDTTLLVYMQQENKSRVVKCSPRTKFYEADRVIVEFINNNPHDTFVIGVVSGGSEPPKPLEYDKLPTEPVQIIRDENRRAYKFIYAYNHPTNVWSQELIRNEHDKVVAVLHSYSDGFMHIRYLIFAEDGLLDRYE